MNAPQQVAPRTHAGPTAPAAGGGRLKQDVEVQWVGTSGVASLLERGFDLNLNTQEGVVGASRQPPALLSRPGPPWANSAAKPRKPRGGVWTHASRSVPPLDWGTGSFAGGTSLRVGIPLLAPGTGSTAGLRMVSSTRLRGRARCHTGPARSATGTPGTPGHVDIRSRLRDQPVHQTRSEVGGNLTHFVGSSHNSANIGCASLGLCQSQTHTPLLYRGGSTSGTSHPLTPRNTWDNAT